MANAKSNLIAIQTMAAKLREADGSSAAGEETTVDATDLATCMALANSLKDNYNSACFTTLNEILAILQGITK